MSENTKCSAFKIIIKSLSVDREEVEKPKVVLFSGTFSPIPLYLLPGSYATVEAST